MNRFLLPFAAAARAALLCSHPATAGIIISEYVEGSSNNKAIELYNTGSNVVDLSAYVLKVYFNGSTTAGQNLLLTGSLAPGGAYGIASSNAAPPVLATADQTFGGSTFNGDDAVVLMAGSSVIDRIGQIGVDPGLEWGTGLTSTADNTLRRNPAVLTGEGDASATFDPSLQWTGFAQDTFDGLGRHQVMAIPQTPVWLATAFGLIALRGARRIRPD